MARRKRRRSGRGVYKPKTIAVKPGSRREVAEGLKLSAAFFLFRRGYACAFELAISAWGGRRADVIGNKVSGHIIMVEVKSSVEDFKADRKWPTYLRSRVADKFYFIFTESVWDKIQAKPELAKRIQKTPGVLLLDEKTGYAYVKKHAATIEVPVENRVSMLARLAWRNGELSKRTQRQRDRIFVEPSPSLAAAAGISNGN
jgi:hypothetical protein